MNGLLSEAEVRLKDLRSDPKYPVVFEKLLKEAVGAMGNESFVVHIDPRDEALCKKTLAFLNRSSEIHADLVTEGGVTLSLPDNAVVISNTVESRLQRAKEAQEKRDPCHPDRSMTMDYGYINARMRGMKSRSCPTGPLMT